MYTQTVNEDSNQTAYLCKLIQVLTVRTYCAFFMHSELQIIVSIKDNSKINFSYFSTKTYVVTPQQNRLVETALMMGHNICFKGVI